jgi:hypothetical protein
MSFDFHPAFFPRPLLLLVQALLEGWGTASIPAKIPENSNAIIEQMYLKKKKQEILFLSFAQHTSSR